MAYQTVQSPKDMAARIKKALTQLECTQTCPIFLMTNCRDVAELEALRKELPSPPVMYQPSDKAFADEGQRLVVEAAVAAHAAKFVASPRSAVSTLVETLRRAKREDDKKAAEAAKVEL